MAKKTATVAYEDSKAVGSLARYEKKVEQALQAMGAPNAAELLAGSQAFVVGQLRAGVEPKHAASVIWHKHCEAGVTPEPPCVAKETEAACPHDPPPEAPKVVAVVVAESASNPIPESGYAYVTKAGGRNFRSIPNDDWEIEVVTPTGTEKEVGLRLIDGSVHRVWKTEDEYWAQVALGLSSTLKGKVRHSSKEEAHDGCLACQPFTRLERDPDKFSACKARAKGPLDTDKKMFLFLREEMNVQDQEVFVVVGLDLHRNLRSYTEVARGQRDRVAVAVEDVLRAVIADGPHGYVIAHNHPSGSANPSKKDKELTQKIREASVTACPNIVFLDHLIVGSDNWYSFHDGLHKWI